MPLSCRHCIRCLPNRRAQPKAKNIIIAIENCWWALLPAWLADWLPGCLPVCQRRWQAGPPRHSPLLCSPAATSPLSLYKLPSRWHNNGRNSELLPAGIWLRPKLRLGPCRSSLCTDLLSREHFNYSTLLTKFQLWLSQLEAESEKERAREQALYIAIWFAAWAVKSWGTQKLVQKQRQICGCWHCKKPAGPTECQSNNVRIQRMWP